MTPRAAPEFPSQRKAVWKRVSSDGYVPRSPLEQQIVLHTAGYQWHGGKPDPAQLPEGYRQLPNDRTRARWSLSW